MFLMHLLPVWLSLVIVLPMEGGCVTNAQDRWPDFMSAILNGEHESKSPKTGVLNLGIGDNRILSVGLGQPGKERFDRDILGTKRTSVQ